MTKEFIPYEQALALKELGFDEPCFGYAESNEKVYYDTPHSIEERMNNYFNKCIKIPLYQQAFRWFREKHKLRSFIDTYAQDEENDWASFYTIKSGNGYDREPLWSGSFKIYEEAELSCLKKLIEIVKQKL